MLDATIQMRYMSIASHSLQFCTNRISNSMRSSLAHKACIYAQTPQTATHKYRLYKRAIMMHIIGFEMSVDLKFRMLKFMAMDIQNWACVQRHHVGPYHLGHVWAR
jgi:hypothetical protein